MSDQKIVVNLAPSLFTMLDVLFIALKLCGVIHWSWLWVLGPFWIPLCLALVFFGFILTMGFVAYIIGERMK